MATKTQRGVWGQIRRAWICALSLLILPCFSRAEERALTGPHTTEEIASLLRDLGDPAYEKRTFATRRLCAIGAAARSPLLEVTNGSDFESAMRAKNVLAVLDETMLTGVEVAVSFSEQSIEWDRSVDLMVTLTNRSQHSARLPFLDKLESDGGSGGREPDALQVSRMLDVADFLRVKAPGGAELDLRVDDISAEPDVVAAVQKRLASGAGVALEAGRSATIRVSAFNRGWARFTLLDEGTYHVSFDYIPDWGDEVLNGQRVGRVTSNTASLSVTKAAPTLVSRGGDVASIVLTQEGTSAVAVLVNRLDQPILINKNYGRTTPFAWARWVFDQQEVRNEVSAVEMDGDTWDDFRQERLIEVAPGTTVEIARTSLEDIRRKLLSTANPGGEGRVFLTYANACDRQWQTRQGAILLGNPNAPRVLQDPLPRRLLSTRINSNDLPLSSLK